MPPSEAPNDVIEPSGEPEVSPASKADESLRTSGQSGSAAPEPEPEPESGPPVVRGSRWVDYDTHELLEKIGELEDERRWARLREGFWIAILFHLALLSA